MTFILTLTAFYIGNNIDSNIFYKNYANTGYNEFTSPTLTTTPKPVVSKIPTPTVATEVKSAYRVAPTIDPDPPVHCSIHPDCGGGTIPLKKSECAMTTCCQIGDQWIFYKDKNKCTADQGGKSSSYTGSVNTNTVPSYPPCTIYYSALGYSQTYNYMSPETCEEWRKTNMIPTYTPVPTIDQKAIDDYNQLLDDHRDACNKAVAEWRYYKERFMEGEGKEYSSSYEAALELERRRQIYQQDLYDAGCTNTI